MALNGSSPQMEFNGMADITIAANNLSAVSTPMNVSFVNGNATIQISSTATQFVTVTQQMAQYPAALQWSSQIS